MGIRNLTPEDLLKEYGKVKEKNKDTERAHRISKDKEELIGFVKTLLDVEFASDEFKNNGIITIAPADFGEAIYDDWATLKGKDKAPTKAYRVRTIKEIIENYTKEKGFFPKVQEGGQGKRTVVDIFKEATKEEPKPEAAKAAAPKAAKAKK